MLSDFNAKSKNRDSIIKPALKEIKNMSKSCFFQTINEPTYILDTSPSCVNFLQPNLALSKKNIFDLQKTGEAPILTAILEMIQNLHYTRKQLQTLCSYSSTFFVSPDCKFTHDITTFYCDQ